MTLGPAPEIHDALPEERGRLEPILIRSFEGWYQRHSIKTLHEVERVRAAEVGGVPAGLCMLKTLDTGIGYIYYIAVDRTYRRRGIGSALLDDALGRLREMAVKEVYASTENDEAARLFGGRGFTRTDFSQVSGRYGFVRALSLYRKMLSVPGEVLMRLGMEGTSGLTGASHG